MPAHGLPLSDRYTAVARADNAATAMPAAAMTPAVMLNHTTEGNSLAMSTTLNTSTQLAANVIPSRASTDQPRSADEPSTRQRLELPIRATMLTARRARRWFSTESGDGIPPREKNFDQVSNQVGHTFEPVRLTFGAHPRPPRVSSAVGCNAGVRPHSAPLHGRSSTRSAPAISPLDRPEPHGRPAVRRLRNRAS